MTSKVNERSKACNLTIESDQRARQLEEKLRLENAVYAALDAKILGWKKDTEALQKKVQESKCEKKVILGISQLQINEETQVGIQHLENVTTLDTEITGFASLIS